MSLLACYAESRALGIEDIFISLADSGAASDSDSSDSEQHVTAPLDHDRHQQVSKPQAGVTYAHILSQVTPTHQQGLLHAEWDFSEPERTSMLRCYIETERLTCCAGLGTGPGISAGASHKKHVRADLWDMGSDTDSDDSPPPAVSERQRVPSVARSLHACHCGRKEHAAMLQCSQCHARCHLECSGFSGRGAPSSAAILLQEGNACRSKSLDRASRMTGLLVVQIVGNIMDLQAQLSAPVC